MTQKPCIICVAITGSLPKKSDNPAVPITIAEQVESAHEAFEAGASVSRSRRTLSSRPVRAWPPEETHHSLRVTWWRPMPAPHHSASGERRFSVST